MNKKVSYTHQYLSRTESIIKKLYVVSSIAQNATLVQFYVTFCLLLPYFLIFFNKSLCIAASAAEFFGCFSALKRI